MINENQNQNFREFINYYRIEYAKNLLRNPEKKNEKISSIAFDSGFGSVTSFNIVFKKHTSTTPQLYRKNIVN